MRKSGVSRYTMKFMLGFVFLLTVCLILGFGAQAEAASWTGVWTTISNPDSGGPANPTDIAVDKSGNIYVTNGNRVEMLPHGSTTWQTLPTAGLTANPCSIAVDKQGSVYVLDYNVVQMLPVGTDTWVNIGGRTETRVWVPGERVYVAGQWTWINGYWADGTTNNGNFFVPTDIEVDDNLNVYVTNSGDYNTDPNTYYSCEKLVNGTWTVLGNQSNGFYLPSGVAIDNAGNVYVANEGDDSIRAYSLNWARMGNTGGNYPDYVHDIAVDKWGHVYADSLDDHAIKAWNGSAWITVRSGGNPEGVTVDSDGNIYVIDTTYHTILKQQAPATQLVWSTPPGGGVGGQAWSQSQQPVLVLKDGNGNVEVDDSTSTVTIALTAANGATLSGTKTVQLVNGTATFTDLSVDQLGSYTLTATINLAGGTITSPASSSFTITAPPLPVVTGVSPTSCLANGGTQITLSGTGFTGVTEVYFGAAVVTTPNIISDTSLTVTAPANPVGTVDVKVKTPYWTSETNANAKLTYTGAAAGAWVGSWTSLGSGTLQYPMDAAVDKAGNLYVADTYNNRIAKLPSGSSQWETVAGSGFTDIYGLAVDAAGSLYVAINFEYKIMKYENGSWSDLSYTGGQWYAKDVAVDSQGNVYATSRGVTKLPSGATAWQDISGNLGSASTWGIAIDQWDNIYVTDSVNNRIYELPHGSSTWQDITYGGGFGSVRGIAVDSSGNVFVTDYTGKKIKELVSGSTQWQDITLEGNFQAPNNMTVDRYDNLYVADFGTSTIKRHQAPAVALAWDSQPGGDKNRIFNQIPKVKLVDANGFTETTDSSHTVTVALNASNGAMLSGTTTVTLVNGAAAFTDLKVDQLGDYTLSASINLTGIPEIESNSFTITDPPAPVISSITPHYGILNGGTLVTITGANFTEASEVYFGNTMVTNHTVISDTSVQVTTPAAAATGTVDVKIKTPFGTSAVSANDQFTYISFRVDSISPASGPANGGTQITITGTGFTGVSSVVLGSQEVTNPVVVNDTTLTFYTPYLPAGMIDVQVKKDGFLSEINANDHFTSIGALPGARIGAWTTLGNEANGGLKYPQALVSDQAGNLYVSDTYYHKVKYLPAGSTTWQDTGSSIAYPYGLVLDSSGNLYVAYNEYNYVYKRLTNGTWQNITYSGGQWYPRGIAVDSQGNVYTTASGVKKLSAGATQWQDISGNMGTYSTWGITVDRWDNIYVADVSRNIIWQLPHGSNQWRDLTYGGGFFQANGIAVDAAGNIYVADTLNKQIKVLPSGATQWQLVPIPNYYNIKGVSLDGSGNLYVTDSYAVKKIAPPATELIWVTQPGGGETGAVWAQQPVLKLVDAQGHTVNNSDQTVTLSLVNASGANLQGTTTVTLQNGITTFADLKIDKEGTYTLAVAFSTANDSIVRANSSSFVITKRPPAQLAWQTQPGGGSIEGILTPQPMLALQDAVGNVIADDSTSTVTLSLTAAGGASLGGTTQVTLHNGIATFTDLSVNKTGSYTLTPVSSLSGISAEPSTAFSITPGAAAQLVWQTQPGNGTGSTVLSQSPVVCLTDAAGNVIAGDSSSMITVTLADAQGAQLSGTTTVTLQNGLASFTDLKIDKAGTYRLTPASSLSGISAAASDSFTISIGAATQLVWQTQPGNGTTGMALHQQPVLQLQDAGGNRLTGDSSSKVSASLNDANGAVLGGMTQVTVQNGQAVFTNLQVNKAGTYSLTMTSSLAGLISPASSAFTISLPAKPVVSSLAPSIGPAQGGTLVTISGTNFTGVTKVYFGTTAVVNPTVVSDTSLTVKAPLHSAGTVDVQVQTPFWTSDTNVNARYTYAAASPLIWQGDWMTLDTASLGVLSVQHVTTDSAGNLYVTDYSKDRVLKLPAGSTTWQTLACTRPLGILADPADHIYVASQSRIMQLQSDDSWTEYSAADFVPASMAFDSAGNLYATSASTCAVYKRSSGGGPWQSISSGTGIENLDFGGIAVDPRDNVYVTTQNENKIYVLPANTTVWQDITYSGGFHYPIGIAADDDGNIYVCDTQNWKVKTLPVGSTQWQDISPLDSFSLPYGITVDSNGNLYVADYFYVKKHLAAAPDPNLKTITVNSAAHGSVTVKVDNSPVSQIAPVEIGKTVTLNAIPDNGYNFSGWYAGETRVSVLPNYSFTVSADLTLNPLFTAMPLSYLEVTTVGSGTVTLNGTTPLTANYKQQHQRSFNLQLSAAATAGHSFSYWQEAVSDSIVSEETTYSCLLGAGLNLKAVFMPIPSEVTTTFTVVFVDKSGKVLQSTSVNKGADATPPANPSLVGYTFTGWDKPFTNVSADLKIRALYQRQETTYTVTVEGGTLSTGGTSGSYQYDKAVTVVAGAAPTGKKFSHWEQDGSKASIFTSFTFYTPQRDTTLTAIFVDEETVLENVPFIVLSNEVLVDRVNKTILFTAHRTVPSGYTLVESGIMLLKSTESPVDLNTETEGAIRGRIKNDSTDQFYIRKTNVTDGDTWNARAYLIYLDGSGNLITVYSSNTVSETM